MRKLLRWRLRNAPPGCLGIIALAVSCSLITTTVAPSLLRCSIAALGMGAGQDIGSAWVERRGPDATTWPPRTPREWSRTGGARAGDIGRGEDLRIGGVAHEDLGAVLACLLDPVVRGLDDQHLHAAFGERLADQ